jgi:hypothetical protein
MGGVEYRAERPDMVHLQLPADTPIIVATVAGTIVGFAATIQHKRLDLFTGAGRRQAASPPWCR